MSIKPTLNTHSLVTAHLATDLAYKIAKGDDVYRQYESSTIEEMQLSGWKALSNSSKFSNTNQNGYKAVVFVKDETKEVLIATAGTNPVDWHDIKDDLYIAFRNYPSKVEQVKDMLNNILESYPDIADHTFSVAGHSLGAILADITAFEIMSRGLKLGTSITFDSPGSKNAINAAIAKGVFNKEKSVDIAELAKHCEIYNAKHNCINYMTDFPLSSFLGLNSPHITAPKMILETKHQAEEAQMSSTFLCYAGYLTKKAVFQVISHCAYYSGGTKILDKLIHTANSHSLENFIDLSNKIMINTESWEQASGLVHIKDFEGLDKVTSTGNEVVLSKYDDEIDFDILSCYAFQDIERVGFDNDFNLLDSIEEDFELIN